MEVLIQEFNTEMDSRSLRKEHLVLAREAADVVEIKRCRALQPHREFAR